MKNMKVIWENRSAEDLAIVFFTDHEKRCCQCEELIPAGEYISCCKFGIFCLECDNDVFVTPDCYDDDVIETTKSGIKAWKRYKRLESIKETR